MELNAILFILCLLILFSLFSSAHGLHLVYAASVGGGEEQKQDQPSSKLDPFDIAANTYGYFIKQLKNFEFTVNLEPIKFFQMMK